MRLIDLVNHFLLYWPIAAISLLLSFVVWAIWVLSIGVSNTRWKRAVQKGSYADSLQKEHIALQNARILILQKSIVSLKKQNTRYRKAIQSMTSTAQRATIVLLEEEGEDEK